MCAKLLRLSQNLLNPADATEFYRLPAKSFEDSLLLDNLTQTKPITIQTISLILIIIPIKIPASAGKPTLLNANAKPPSRTPNCIGKKKMMFANREEAELIIKASKTDIFKLIAIAVK